MSSYYHHSPLHKRCNLDLGSTLCLSPIFQQDRVNKQWWNFAGRCHMGIQLHSDMNRKQKLDHWCKLCIQHSRYKLIQKKVLGVC